MDSRNTVSPALVSDLEAKGVDVERTFTVLSLIEQDRLKAGKKTGALHLPGGDDRRISDMTGPVSVTMPLEAARERFADLEINPDTEKIGTIRGNSISFDSAALERLGVLLYPKLAYGVLNGGMATSYTDIKKNKAVDAAAFSLLEKEFDILAQKDRGLPKGAGSAYIDESGKPGPSFLLLKMRSLLIKALEYRLVSGDTAAPVLPFFQMTSTGTAAALAEAYTQYRKDPLLADLIDRTGTDPTRARSRVQGFLAALTHSSEGFPRKIFSRAYGEENRGLALPGGHGENFRILAPLYRELRKEGIRFVYLGNVDNLGYTADPRALALLALRGGELAFEFSWRTAVDIKGGVLTEDDSGRLSVGDIGQAISADKLREEEAAGKRALFNCATGLFDLDFLTDRSEAIQNGIPIRVSDQDKEAGLYAQAEQTTWEVLGLADNPRILAVSKEDRFLAAKMLMETLLASPVSARIDNSPEVPPEIRDVSRGLRRGLGRLLEEELGFAPPDSRGIRRVLTVPELESNIRKKYGIR
ncbi:UTP--glucose-1-phosphate uridylyltransferase [Breznakiella homolactica]|uniref:UTP--glucose-1-phosphate uridylyltransferase n=1 Tax=Breznakiella homolactica TaxID=2798577 RepID=A0A7T7XQ95_9SPIR|nr:UTP--glucose-1-phosphate uridylyltransferase [Breznakiella homolactica]QQO10493.1 UTP--glucose-1-phosphate uridylyltransferase [Breznakiella homolactica]